MPLVVSIHGFVHLSSLHTMCDALGVLPHRRNTLADVMARSSVEAFTFMHRVRLRAASPRPAASWALPDLFAAGRKRRHELDPPSADPLRRNTSTGRPARARRGGSGL